MPSTFKTRIALVVSGSISPGLMFPALMFIASMFAALTIAPVARAQQCPVDAILIKGHVEHPPRHPSVRVQLFYPPDPHRKHTQVPGAQDSEQAGESTEAILDGNSFTIPVEFVTSDRRTQMNFNPRCEHKPQSVIVTLEAAGSGGNDNDQVYDRVTLDFPHDFQSDDQRHYTLRNEVVLNGQP